MIDTKLHDGLCRCRVCKPPLAGSYSMEWNRVVIGGVVLAGLVFALCMYRALGL